MSDQENLPSAAGDAETKQHGRPFQPGEGIQERPQASTRAQKAPEKPGISGISEHGRI